MRTLQEEFLQNRGEPIQFNGQHLFWTYWLPVAHGDTIEVSFVRFTPRPVQGIGLEAEKCKLRIGGSTSKKFGIWTDTAPRSFEIAISQAKPGARIGIFNQWRDEVHGTTMYRLNNAAIDVRPQADGSVLLMCSDGRGEPEFNDLVVRIRHQTDQAG